MATIVGKIDGEVFSGGSAEDAQVVLGGGNFIPGFEEGLTGAKAGDDREVDATFPADYPETAEYFWYRSHFEGDSFVLASWEGCTLDDPRVHNTLGDARAELATGLFLGADECELQCVRRRGVERRFSDGVEADQAGERVDAGLTQQLQRTLRRVGADDAALDELISFEAAQDAGIDAAADIGVDTATDIGAFEFVPALVYKPLEPCRIMDTRSGLGGASKRCIPGSKSLTDATAGKACIKCLGVVANGFDIVHGGLVGMSIYN